MKGPVLSITLSFLLMLLVIVTSAQEGIISGSVFGSEGPLEAVTISVGSRSVISHKNGWFSLAAPAGKYKLSVTHVGYEAYFREVTIVSRSVQTFDIRLQASGEMGEIVILGSQAKVQRSNLMTAVPIDIFTHNQLVRTGQVSLTQMLNFSAPSFNASRPLSAEPATLRGLSPDQLLVLVNGTRKHNMAYITPAGLRGMLGPGTVGNDLNAIPFTAIEKIEILRDGAAAQYGSDAIAGVINIHLKKATDRTTFHVQGSQYYKGDGEAIIIGVNHGLSFRGKGFLNFSADFRHNKETFRGGVYTGTVYSNNKPIDDSIVRARGFNRGRVSNGRTSPQTRGGLLVNGGYPVGVRTELFWTATANKRKSSFMSGYVFPKNSIRINPNLFPDGYAPRAYHYSTDVSGMAGLAGETANAVRWKFTSAYGRNSDPWYVKNTNNPSQYYTLGKNAPTSFYTGTLIYGQLINDLHLSKNVSTNGKQSTYISFGAEWRLENYQMRQGEEAAWKNYDSLARKVGNPTGLIVYPANVVNKSRHVSAMYLDLETEPTSRLLVNIAGRYEHYSDFGGNMAGKLSARYKLFEALLIRGSINNGFRAPSLQQRFYSSTNNSFVNIGGVVYPSITGTFRNDSPVAQALGIPGLTAERSLNASAGITGSIWKSIRLTVDAYWIQIKNRIVVSSGFDTSNAAVKTILKPFPDVTQVLFYANAINTKTMGVDLVLNGNWRSKAGNIGIMLAANFTQTRLFGNIEASSKLAVDSINSNTLFSRNQRGRLEHEQPAGKLILLLNYTTGKFRVLVRNTRFGRTGIRFNTPSTNPDENFSPKILTDVSLSHTPNRWLTITAGSNNLFDVYPDPIRHFSNTDSGADIYSKDASPFGFNGGYYFVSFSIQLGNR
jgi:iron complex outermembrane receptor protein